VYRIQGVPKRREALLWRAVIRLRRACGGQAWHRSDAALCPP
jgi:hypothetical protein